MTYLGYHIEFICSICASRKSSKSKGGRKRKRKRNNVEERKREEKDRKNRLENRRKGRKGERKGGHKTDLGSIPGRVIPKTLKMVLDTTLLNTQQYKVRIKGKEEQSRGKE